MKVEVIHKLTFAELLEEDPSEVEYTDILKVKRSVGGLAELREDQFYCLNALVSMESEAFKINEMEGYFQNLVLLLKNADQLLARLEDRARDVHQHYILTLQERTNKRLNILAVLSAIYLPSTLIAGIYGMNFENIPVVEMAYGYAIVMAVMILLVAGQLIFFYLRGWFK